jgi:hypothetical protein
MNKLMRWFALWMGAMLLFVLLTQPAERPDKLADASFTTSESAQMYFTNVRSYYYLSTEEGNGRFRVHRYKPMTEQTDSCFIPLVIYDHWRANEAFIRWDTTLLRPSGVLEIRCECRDEAPVTLLPPDGTTESEYYFARDLYRTALPDCRVALVSSGGMLCEVAGTSLRNTRRVLTDYFKLLGKL